MKQYSAYASSPDDYPERWEGCPECSSPNVEPVFQCCVCGEYATEGIRIKSDKSFICDQCYERVYDV